MPDLDLLQQAQELLKKELIVERFAAILNTVSLPAATIEFDLSKLDLDWGLLIMLLKEGQTILVYGEERAIEVGERIFSLEMQESGNYQRWMKAWENDDTQFHELCATLEKTNLSILTLPELHQRYVDFISAFRKAWALPLTATPFAYYVEKIQIPQLRKKYGARGVEEFVLLATPLQSSLMRQEEEELLQIAVEIDVKKIKTLSKLKTNAPLIYLRLQDHASTYHWIHNTYRDVKRLDEHYFFKQLQEIHHPCALAATKEKQKKELRKKYRQLLKKKQFSTEEMLLAKLVAQATLFQDLRKRNNLIGNYHMLQFLKEIEKRTSYSYDELCCSTFLETGQVLAGKTLSTQTLQARMQGAAHILNTKEERILDGKNAQKMDEMVEKTLHQDANSNQRSRQGSMQQIFGTCASPGVARGIVRVVPDVSKVKIFNQGDILVASMTRPEYMLLMKKAAAIITNEGGITCHAAIISRELKIPCIIGTKIATQVLKDGDLVEVDANKARITLITRA